MFFNPPSLLSTFCITSSLPDTADVHGSVVLSQFYRTNSMHINSLARTVMKAAKSCHITPILRSLHWLRITELIEYKLLSLTYKVLTTTQPPYLHNFISTQRPRSTRSSSVVTLAWPPSSSSLKITDRSFRYASLCLFINLILAPVPPFPTHLFLHPSLLTHLIHHFVHL